ncbi:MAG TPA: DUF4142 domain-containing protein [Sphingomonas sp.]|nr:DUF4142 domain-containing protein [Sphingomonas sp.]
MRMRTFLLLAPALVALACSPAVSPNAFLTKAIQGDNSEMRLGAIAASKGGSAVAEYGRMLVADHTKARADAVAVATRYGVTPPTEVLPEASKEQDKLAGLTGTAFDREFVSYMLDDHKSDISDFMKEIDDSSTPADVRKLAQDTLPHLRTHLDMAKRLT